MNPTLTIPRRIFQTWKTHSVPEKWKTSPDSIKIYMPSWKHVLFDDQDNLQFVQDFFPEYVDLFVHLRYPIQRADFIRYCYLFIYGGVYADLDIEFISPIDNLFVNVNNENDPNIVYLLKAPKNFAGHYTNFFMASTPRNPFWLVVLRECLEPLAPWVRLPHNIISEQTGLACLSRAVKKALQTNQSKIITLPFHNLVPCDICSDTSEYVKKPFYYTKFLKGGSWNGLDTFIFNSFFCNFIEWICIGVFFILVLFLKRLKLKFINN